MSRRKDDTPSVATYADYEVITPPHELRKVVAPAGDVVDDPVARAEAALAELSSEFSGWMESECDRLEAARQDVKRDGFTPKTHDTLFRAAHDIKGEAGTFGYPAVAGDRRQPVPARRAYAGHAAHSAAAGRPARRCHTRRGPRICPSRPARTPPPR